MEFNTLYQLLAMKLANSPMLETAQSFLMMPDLFHWLLTGDQSQRATRTPRPRNSTIRTRGLGPRELLEQLRPADEDSRQIVQPGTRLGKIAAAGGRGDRPGRRRGNRSRHARYGQCACWPCRPPASRARKPDWCYISSGTWSLMGVETPQPVINDRCCELNFTNEGGVGGTTRLLKNIAGLWLVQECRRIWKQAGQEYGWEELMRAGRRPPPLARR